MGEILNVQSSLELHCKPFVSGLPVLCSDYTAYTAVVGAYYILKSDGKPLLCPSQPVGAYKESEHNKQDILQ